MHYSITENRSALGRKGIDKEEVLANEPIDARKISNKESETMRLTDFVDEDKDVPINSKFASLPDEKMLLRRNEANLGVSSFLKDGGLRSQNQRSLSVGMINVMNERIAEDSSQRQRPRLICESPSRENSQSKMISRFADVKEGVYVMLAGEESDVAVESQRGLMIPTTLRLSRKSPSFRKGSQDGLPPRQSQRPSNKRQQSAPALIGNQRVFPRVGEKTTVTNNTGS